MSNSIPLIEALDALKTTNYGDEWDSAPVKHDYTKIYQVKKLFRN